MHRVLCSIPQISIKKKKKFNKKIHISEEMIERQNKGVFEIVFFFHLKGNSPLNGYMNLVVLSVLFADWSLLRNYIFCNGLF